MADAERERSGDVADVDGDGDAPSTSSSSDDDLWCCGPLLAAVQSLRLFPDSKHFVDMPLLTSRESVEEEFNALVRDSPKEDEGDGDRLVRLCSPLGASSRGALSALVAKHFASPGTELEAFEPPDYAETPGDFLPRVREQVAREFALRVHRLWPHLCRRRNVKNRKHPSSSLLETSGWCVVPGERFRECYYWDSYWTVRGLLASRMHLTAAAVVRTLCELAKVKKNGNAEEGRGTIPNGARSYYLGRSQPPLLADAAAALLRAVAGGSGKDGREERGADETTKAIRALVLDVALPAAKEEHAAWCRWPRSVLVAVEGQNGKETRTARLARYRPHRAPGPRPEAWREDTELSLSLRSLSDEEAKGRLWMALAAAAESGWDFSTRWLAGGVAGGGGGEGKGTKGDDGDETTARPNPRLGLAHRVVPVDLNVFLCRAEAAISRMCSAAGDAEGAARYSELAERRLRDVDALLWDEESRSWADLSLPGDDGEEREGDAPLRAERRNGGRYASCWTPLWARRAVAEAAEAARGASDARRGLPSPLDVEAARSLRSSGLVGPSGLVATSLRFDSGEQWDGANAWPPLQAIVAEGLADVASAASDSDPPASLAASELSEGVVRALCETAGAGLERDGCVREKYRSDDEARTGAAGGGGEYDTQVGFGWSNGSVLALLRRFGWPPDARGSGADAGEVGD